MHSSRVILLCVWFDGSLLSIWESERADYAFSSCSLVLDLNCISTSKYLAYLALIYAPLPMQHIYPRLTMIPILFESYSASSIEWVVKRIEEALKSSELFYISFITCHICCLAYGSTPEEGSSSNTTLTFPIRAIPTESFLLFPPLRFWDYLFLSV